MFTTTKFRAKIYLKAQNFLLYLLKSLRKKRSAHFTIENNPNIFINSSTELDGTDDISIIISTFESRFFEYTIPLISSIRSELDVPIFVVINGNFKKTINNFKLQKFIVELGKFKDIYPIAFANFHGCSELWNTGIVHADSDYFLIFNDDIHVYPKNLKAIFPRIRQLISENGLVTINRSFSHFGISLKCIEEIGFFDEHFLGIGEEDRDYFFRYESKYGEMPQNLSTDAFYNFGDESRDDSVKKISDGKYSYFNTAIKQEFYAIDPEGIVQGRYENPVKRVKKFIDPRPLWKFRKSNYEKLGE